LSQPAATPAPDDFAPVEAIAGRVAAGVLFLCDHASNSLPAQYGDLGLPAEAFQRHIAYDIGSAGVTRALAARFNAPALLTRYSRLLIDPNRGADDPTLVMQLSDGAVIPGNSLVDAPEIARRIALYWSPYRQAASALLDQMSAAGPVPAIVSLHSFTPVWRGSQRPWRIGLLWDNDPRLAQPLLEGLEAAGLGPVGDNEPYDGALKGDTLYELASARGLPHVLIEIRQDLIADAAGQIEWAARIADALAPVLARPDIHRIEQHGSRASARSQRTFLRRPT
jgi:predicted N-formylglutamate amidohydrolase